MERKIGSAECEGILSGSLEMMMDSWLWLCNFVGGIVDMETRKRRLRSECECECECASDDVESKKEKNLPCLYIESPKSLFSVPLFPKLNPSGA